MARNHETVFHVLFAAARDTCFSDKARTCISCYFKGDRVIYDTDDLQEVWISTYTQGLTLNKNTNSRENEYQLHIFVFEHFPVLSIILPLTCVVLNCFYVLCAFVLSWLASSFFKRPVLKKPREKTI